MNLNQFRQGDVLLEKIEMIPSNAIKVGNNIVALGESSNHGHFIHGGELFCVQEELFIEANSQAELRHLNIHSLEPTCDHKTLNLPKGKYRVIHQREFDPYLDTVKRLQD
jgi:hypothetical protein